MQCTSTSPLGSGAASAATGSDSSTVVTNSLRWCHTQGGEGGEERGVPGESRWRGGSTQGGVRAFLPGRGGAGRGRERGAVKEREQQNAVKAPAGAREGRVGKGSAHLVVRVSRDALLLLRAAVPRNGVPQLLRELPHNGQQGTKEKEEEIMR